VSNWFRSRFPRGPVRRWHGPPRTRALGSELANERPEALRRRRSGRAGVSVVGSRAVCAHGSPTPAKLVSPAKPQLVPRLRPSGSVSVGCVMGRRVRGSSWSWTGCRSGRTGAAASEVVRYRIVGKPCSTNDVVEEMGRRRELAPHRSVRESQGERATDAGADDRAPGAGKGTQGALIAEHFAIPHIVMG
jgi:hypothetical protein